MNETSTQDQLKIGITFNKGSVILVAIAAITGFLIGAHAFNALREAEHREMVKDGVGRFIPGEDGQPVFTWRGK